MIDELKDRYDEKAFFARYSLIFPEYFPPMRYLTCDDGGRIYVKTYAKDGNDRIYWDVFNPEGRYITKFSLPKRELIWDIKNNFIYTGMHGTKKRNPVVKRYNMVWQ